MSTLYSTKVTATGGRHGHIRSEDGLLDMKPALPRELGGKGDATNPETLFAGSAAAVFLLDKVVSKSSFATNPVSRNCCWRADATSYSC